MFKQFSDSHFQIVPAIKQYNENVAAVIQNSTFLSI